MPDESEMQTGKIKWFSDEKGYGFIIPDDGSPDIFFHKRDAMTSGIKHPRRALNDGREVRFRSEDNIRGNGKKLARYIELV